MIDFGTSQSPKSTRPLTTHLCPSRTWLPYETGRRIRRPALVLPLWRYAHDG
ncbi:hypothetical protein [Thiolapillus sp.]|uniref:hypothetical protein n=1 Tax=Thiolapillus sp. TaxID=2017437 RepID=UPI003AF7019E